MDTQSRNVIQKSRGYRELIVERRDHILLIKFNRPSVKNALNRRSYLEIIRALYEASNDERITVVVFTGEGDFYTSGNDLTQTAKYANASEFFRASNLVLRLLVKAFINCPKVLVALVNGPCIGVGVTLSALCDVIYCTDNAYFQAPFVKLGICPEACSSYTLPLIMGRSKSAELLLFGEKLTAREAYEFHFVAGILHNSVDNFWPRLMEYASLPPKSLKATKRLLRSYDRQAMLQALQFELEELQKFRFGEVFLKNLEEFIARSTAKKNKSKL